VPELILEGCRTRPLAGYLKGLGILRVLAQQHDPRVRVRWHGGALELSSDLDADGLRDFWMRRYAPTPVLSPWNGGSGFYARGNSAAVANLAGIERSDDERLRRYRDLAGLTHAILRELEITETPDRERKAQLVRAARRRWPDQALEWLDAAIVLTDGGLAFPPILGSGGNDGRFDFSSNYMRAVADVLLGRESSLPLLDASLLGSPTRLARTTLAHFERDDSPVNSPTARSPTVGNPWDLVLSIEGAVALTAGAARRLGTSHRGRLVAPFTARSTAAGYGSAVNGEAGRAELWLPLWSAWITYRELSALVRESRAEVGSGAGRRTASSGLDFVRAAGELGVARGIDAFERYSLLERAGQATLAVPVGRVVVAPRHTATALRSLDPWLTRVRALATDDRCPKAIVIAASRLERAAFALASSGSADDACHLLEAMGAMEQALARSVGTATGAGIRPLNGADAAAWTLAASDGTEEFVVAAAIASLSDRAGARRSPALRDYLHGTIDAGRAFDESRRHAIPGTTAVTRLAGIHARRHLDAFRGSAERDGGLSPHPGYTFGSWCPLPIVHRFAANKLDDDRIMRLVLGMALLDRDKAIQIPVSDSGPDWPLPALDLLLLAWARTEALTSGASADVLKQDQLGPRPGWAARLAGDSTGHVIGDALRRLRMAGLAPLITRDDLTCAGLSGPRLSASLLLSISSHDVRSIRRRLMAPQPRGVTPPELEEAA
jgi:CRISPR-associated protein Csx17